MKVIPMDEKGELDLSKFSALLNEKTKVVFVNHVSNALGTVNPIETIIEKLRYGWDLMTGPDGGVNTFVDKKDIEHRSIGVKMQLENDTYDFLGLSLNCLI